MISTTNVRIESRTDKINAWADVHQICSGYAHSVEFTPKFGGGFFLAHKADDPSRKALLIAPGSNWKQDLEDQGWVIEQELLP